MKNRYSSLFALMLLLGIVTISSCEIDPDSPDHIIGRVAVDSTSDGAIHEYLYDAQDRVTQEVYTTPGTDPITTQYTYGTNTVTKEVLQNGNQLAYIVYTLDINGRATSADNGHTYTYDAEGHLISDVSGSSHYINTWVNGNNTLSESQTIDYTITNSFLADKTEYREYGLKWFGTGDKGVRYASVAEYNGATVFDITYNHEYDSKGRVSRMTEESWQGGSSTTVIHYYTYDE